MATISKNNLFKCSNINSMEQIMNTLSPYDFSRAIHRYMQGFAPNDNMTISLDSEDGNLVLVGNTAKESYRVNTGIVCNIISSWTNKAPTEGNTWVIANIGEIFDFKQGDLILAVGVAGYNENDEIDNECDLILEVSYTSSGTRNSFHGFAYSPNGKSLSVPMIPKGTKLIKIKNGLLAEVNKSSDILNKMTLDEWEDFVYKQAKVQSIQTETPQLYYIKYMSFSNDSLTVSYKNDSSTNNMTIECDALVWKYVATTDIDSNNQVVDIVLQDYGESPSIIKVGDQFLISYGGELLTDLNNYAGLTKSGATYKHKILEVVEVKEDNTFAVRCINSDNCTLNITYLGNKVQLLLIKS